MSGDRQSTEEKKPLNRIFMRPGVIEEEPDSLDSVISNLPLTVVPSLARISTVGSGFSRQESVRGKREAFDGSRIFCYQQLEQ
ncbi:hypothetical protein AND_008727 [Anopheles darlingi]|uniref:Uncharacterized protein n=1 Tax=Anopheles darlingi TaxID=43151 RepID=W5J8K8_ANODA|nr:hypothetical protein AND_008727 [Anopheles darlingi]